MGELHLVREQRAGDHVRLGDQHAQSEAALCLLGGQAQGGGVALVPVDDHHPPHARLAQAGADVDHHRGQRARLQGQSPAPPQVVVGDPERAERGHHGAEPLGNPLGHRQRCEGVGAERQVRPVLLDAAGGQHRRGAGLQQPGRARLGHALQTAVAMPWQASNLLGSWSRRNRLHHRPGSASCQGGGPAGAPARCRP
jgi:hypothetical protein